MNILVAQTREEARAKAEVKIEEYKERLNLSEEQVQQVKDLRTKYRPEFQSIRDDESKTKSDKMRARADLMDEREAELEEILDDEQMAELKVIRSEMRENAKARKENRRGRRGGN